MRHLLTFVLMLSLVGSAVAADLGTSRNIVKGMDHVGMNMVSDRDGGEDVASAAPITALPFADTGATCDNLDDYDVECPYSGSVSADVVYSFTPAMDISVDIDLFGSGYDTKVYVFDAAMTVVACNDDAYDDYTSAIIELALTGGETYFIVIDGYGGDCGSYVLNVTEFETSVVPEPCPIVCDGDVDEGEPTLVNGYEDMYNGGCISTNFAFQSLEGRDGTLDFCGIGGWYIASDSAEHRDTDWFMVTFGEAGVIEWTVDSQSVVDCYLLEIVDCPSVDINVPLAMVAGPCAPASMTITGEPGSVAFLFVASQSYSQADANHMYNEFIYTSSFTGLLAIVDTEEATWDSVKSLYR